MKRSGRPSLGVIVCFQFFFILPLIGLSATLIGLTESRLSVRPFVRHAISRKLRIRFWWFFAHSYILTRLKKCSKRIFEKIQKWALFGQNWLILAIFGLKIRFLDISSETAHQNCLKFGQKLGTVALYHLMVVLCLGKFLFWPFCPFFGQKYIACGDIIWFWAIFGRFLQNRWCFFASFCYLSYVYGLEMVNENLSSDEKILATFGPFFCPKIVHFCPKVRIS